MKLFYLLPLLAFAAPTYAQSAQVKELDAKNGFRDVRLGSPVSELKGAVLVKEGSTQKIYSRPTDALKIGEAAVANIYYIYYKDKLLSVRIFTKGRANSRMVLDAFIMSYGPGYQNNKYIEKYAWNGQSVDMSYQEDRNGDSLIDIDSKTVADEQLADSFKQAEKAKADL